LDQNGQPKVTDFGLAKKLGSDSNLTGTGQILGTPSYMAPEQASGKIDEVGPLADMYSLGAILYCLLTGRPPFQASNPMDTILQVIDREPIPPRKMNPSVPLDLDTITMRCLEKEPKSRFPTAHALTQELERFLRNEPIQSRPIGPLERTRKWVRRRPQTAGLIATSFLAISLLVIGIPLVRMREAKLQENVGNLTEDLVTRSGEAALARQVAETAVNEKQSSLRQKLEKELEGQKVRVYANIERIQAIRKGVVPGSSQEVESLFLETAALQKSMSVVAVQLGKESETQNAAYWDSLLPKINEEGIVWLTSSRLLSASGNANQQGVSLNGHAFALAKQPAVQVGNVSRAFAVSMDGKWLVRPIAEKPPGIYTPYSPIIRQLELVSLEKVGASQILTPSITGEGDFAVKIGSWSSTFTSTNQLKIAFIRIRNGVTREIELVVQTRSLPLGKVEVSHSIDLMKALPPIKNSYPEKSSAENFVFVSPAIEFSQDGSRVTIYQSNFTGLYYGSNLSPVDSWPAATFDATTGECLGKSLACSFPAGLVANDSRLLLLQGDEANPGDPAISGFRVLDLISGELVQRGGQGPGTSTNRPHPFSLDPFPIKGVPSFHSRCVQVSPDGNFIAVAMESGYTPTLRLIVIRTADMSTQSIEMPSNFKSQTSAYGDSADRPLPVRIAIRADSAQICLITGDNLHVFSIPELQLITSQPIHRSQSPSEANFLDASQQPLIRPFFASYLDDHRIACGFVSEPSTDGYRYGREPDVNDLAKYNERWQIFELAIAPLSEVGQIQSGGAKTALLIPGGKDALVAGEYISRVDLGSIRVEQAPGIDGRRGPQMRVPSNRWLINNGQNSWRQFWRNNQHFSIQQQRLRRPQIKNTTSRFMDQDDGIWSFVRPESDFDASGRWFIHGDEIWNVASGDKRLRFATESRAETLSAISGRWLAICASGNPSENSEQIDTKRGEGVVASNNILVWDLENDREHRSIPVTVENGEGGFYALQFLPFTPVLLANSARKSILNVAEGNWLPADTDVRRADIRSARQVDPAGRTYLYEYSKERVQDQQRWNEQRFGMARLSDGSEIFSSDAQDLSFAVYSPKGTWLAYLAASSSQPTEIKGELCLTSTETGVTKRRTLGFAPNRDFAACDFEFGADEQYIVVSADQTSSVMREQELTKKGSRYFKNVIEVWRIADWSRVSTTADNGNALKYFVHPTADTIAIEFNGVNQPGITGSGTSIALDYESEALKERPWVEVRQLSTGNLIQKHSPATMATITGDGAHLVLKDNGGDSNTKVVDTASGEVVLELGVTVGPIEVSPNGSLLLGHVFQGKAPRLWNVRDKIHVDLEVPANLPLGFLPDGQQVIAFDQEKSEITLWNASNGKRTLQFSLGGDHTLDGGFFRGTNFGNSLFRMSPDSKSLAVWMSNELRVFGLDDGKLRFSLPRSSHAADVLALDLSPDGRWIATGSADQSVGIWNADTGEPFATLDGYGASVTEVNFTEDGRYLLTRDAMGKLVMWQLKVTEGPTLKVKLHWKIQDASTNEKATSIAMIGSKKQFAYGRADGSIALARLSDGVTERTFPMQSSGRPVSIAARADGKMLGVASSDGSVYLWDLEQGALPVRLDPGQGAVGALSFPPGNDTLLTGGTDLRLWSLTDHRLLLQCENSDSFIHGIHLSPDARDLLIVREDGSYSQIAFGARQDGLRSLGFGW
jgi:WD40 repeat protein